MPCAYCMRAFSGTNARIEEGYYAPGGKNSMWSMIHPWAVWGIGVCCGMLLVAGTAIAFVSTWTRWIMKKMVNAVTYRIFTEPYTKNLLEALTALRKVGVQWTAENELRAHEGRGLDKPIGSSRSFPHFDGLLFTPPPIWRRPLDLTVPVSLETVIGKNAHRPMYLSMPIMVSAMGYGVALSKPMVRAIAKGTAMAGTACNAGQGPALEEFRTLAHRFVVQFHRAPWMPSDATLRQADMIEIRFGQGANVGGGTWVSGTGLPPETLADLGLQSEEDVAYIPAGHPEGSKWSRLKGLVSHLREVGGGVPIAVKIAAGHHLERDLDLLVRAGADVIVIDGAQGGTHSSPAILVDDFGLPTLSAICRAVRFLEEHGLKGRVDLVVSGGIRTPGDIMKALALGADGVYVGTAALFATVHTQLTKVIPFEPPTQLAWANSSMWDHFDEDAGALSLAKYLMSCADEIAIGLRALGKKTLRDLNADDLIAWDPEVARITGRPLV